MASPAAWVERFLAHVKLERRLSPHTVAAYAHELSAFSAWCQAQDLEVWTRVDGPAVRRFAARSHAGGLKPRSVQRRLSALRTFFGFLIREGLTTHNPALGISAPKADKHLPDTLDVDQMGRLLSITPTTAVQARDLSIMELFYSSGLRLAELVGLNSRDLNLEDRTVRVLGKGSKARIVPVGARAVTALRRWIGERPSMAGAAESAVFVNQRGTRLGARSVQLLVARCARSQGLASHVHPHLFRHSFATHLLESCLLYTSPSPRD